MSNSYRHGRPAVESDAPRSTVNEGHPEIVEANIYTIFQLLWREKLLISGVALVGFLAALAYALSAPEWYTARIVLSPANENISSTIPGDLTGIASLVGLDIGSSSSAEAKAILTSRKLTAEFITDNNLLTLLFAKEWDSANNSWAAADPEDWPDVRDAVDYFEKAIRRIRDDSSTGLITLFIDWKDPELAAAWANDLADRVNQEMRRRALEESTSNIEYLEQQIAETNQVTLQQSISRVLESELQRLLIARGNNEFAFKVIDPAEVPKYKSRPQRTLIVAAALLFSLFLASIIVFALEVYKQQEGGLAAKQDTGE